MSGVQSIERAFALLRALAAGPAGVTELAERTELPKSTVSRLLSALVTEGAVEQAELAGRYRIGSGLSELAASAGPDRNLVAAARPFLVELTERTGETSGISILAGDEVLYLDTIQAEGEIQLRDWTGEVAAVNVVPSGFVLLVGAGPDVVDRLLSGPLTRSTERSLTDPAQVRARLEQVEREGHAWGCGEFDDSINSVAAPVRRRGAIVAAVHVHGPAFRFPADGAAGEVAALVRDIADRLSDRLG
jgi:IclR family acetate operon transcriptional repressor